MTAYNMTQDKAPVSGYVFCRAASTTSVPYEIPAAWKGRDIIITANGANLYVVFGTSASVTAVADQVSTLATAALTAHASTCARIPENGALKVNVPLKNDAGTAITHFAVIADATTGYWVAWNSGEV